MATTIRASVMTEFVIRTVAYRKLYFRLTLLRTFTVEDLVSNILGIKIRNG